MKKKNNNNNNTVAIKPSNNHTLAHAPARVGETLCELLHAKNAIELTVQGLIEGLTATRSFATGQGSCETEPDYATRHKTITTILEYLVGAPVKRTQVLHGEMIKAVPSREELKETIEKKIVDLISRGDVTLNQLMAAKKSIIEADAKEPADKMTEADYVEAARQIHGMNPQSETIPADK